MKELITDPMIVLVIIEIVAVIIAKLDTSDSVANLIIKLGEKLKSKK